LPTAKLDGESAREEFRDNRQRDHRDQDIVMSIAEQGGTLERIWQRRAGYGPA